ncbi:UMP-CMP kinase [Tephrocybe sp. NHM501043]|nr:UMP-CMP kinase [Tephrocybe sp. NHM501043]
MAPTFDNSKVTVLFVLGGPGAGKGTQCAKLVTKYGFCHLSAGDLLREEQNREGSEVGQLIQTCIREGIIVPMEVTIKLLETAMKAAMAENRPGEGWQDGRGRFLIDGFPRKMDQAVEFDRTVCLSSAVLFFSTSEEIMKGRLLVRGETSGREDDNLESIMKRFRTYKQDTMPVIEYYSSQGKVAEIEATGTIEEVHVLASQIVNDALAGKYSTKVVS